MIFFLAKRLLESLKRTATLTVNQHRACAFKSGLEFAERAAGDSKLRLQSHPVLYIWIHMLSCVFWRTTFLVRVCRSTITSMNEQQKHHERTEEAPVLVLLKVHMCCSACLGACMHVFHASVTDNVSVELVSKSCLQLYWYISFEFSDSGWHITVLPRA